MPVTEVGCMTVRPGLDVMNETTREGKIVTTAWKAVTSEKTGPYRVSWGLEEENPVNFWAFFDFASVEEHQKFAQEHGSGIVKDFPEVFDRGLFTKHIDVNPYPAAALKSPVTEIMLAFFPSDVSDELKTAASDRVARFSETSLKKCADVQAVSFGWGVENDFPVRGGEEGQKGSMLIALIGWPSIDAHMKYRETDLFKDSVPLIRGIEGLTALGMFHVKSQNMENEVRKV
ncbi:hypothetical protein M406DRAFT_358121 [Cryphonectria parasitica EP155]|uniref:ABM domain-containing protein n=1 Tax=Cryphonectria parasitica (strain ATCC 38755 / EP155) TaxID=660469 RepID=A0A9P5CLI6_CRYP1|nr:uncharacterized protein M406DRAFT_358121 [Cryphonectria parasitica EP155]KAF3761870.1 hypothetical protein M406DRAFT_358121 [Cryphonectria parasitica EP155]